MRTQRRLEERGLSFGHGGFEVHVYIPGGQLDPWSGAHERLDINDAHQQRDGNYSRERVQRQETGRPHSGLILTEQRLLPSLVTDPGNPPLSPALSSSSMK